MLIEWLYLIALVMIVFLNITVLLISLSRRKNRPAFWFTVLQAVVTFASLCYVFLVLSNEIPVALFWARLRFLPVSFEGPALFFFVLSLTGREHWLKKPVIVIASIVSIITNIIIWFFPDFFWQSWTLVIGTVISTESVTFVGWYSIHEIHAYILGIWSYYFIIQYAFNTSAVSRRQAITLLIGLFVVMVSGLLPLVTLESGTTLNLFPLGMGITTLTLFWALVRQNLLKLTSTTYHHIIQQMQDIVFVINPENRVLLANPPAQKLLYPRSESDIIGQTMYTLFPNNRALIQQYATVPDAQFELNVNIDDDPTCFDVRISSIYNSLDLVENKLVILRDITSRKRDQQHLFELRLEKERATLLANFIQNSAHEFRTPLSVIRTNTYLMTRLDDADKRLQKGEQVYSQIDRITNLLDMLLTMSRLGAQSVSLDETVNLINLLQQLCDDCRTKYGEKPKLVYENLSELPEIKADQTYLENALRQILENAYRFTSEEGVITVTADCGNGTAWIDVHDTGAGIAEDEIPHIFETFWRRDEAHTTSGLGLGLPIARRIIEYHGGEITVTSDKTSGTRFRVALPLQPSHV